MTMEENYTNLKGDHKMKNSELVVENIKLAYYMAQHWKRKAYWMDLNELMSTAQFGLVKAAETFNDELGVPFGAYAGKCINNEILRLIRNIKHSVLTISIEAGLNNSDEYWGDNETTIEDTLSMENNPIEEWTTNQVLQQCLNKLTEKERLLIYKAYMEDMKEADLAKLLGVSQPHLNRLKKKALEKMREVIKEIN